MEGRTPIGFEIRSLYNLIMRTIEKVFDGKEADGITATNGWIIGFLAANPDREIYQRDLEAEFSITRSTPRRQTQKTDSDRKGKEDQSAEDRRHQGL